MHYSWLRHQREGGVWAGAHRKEDTVGVGEDDAGGGCRNQRRWRVCWRGGGQMTFSDGADVLWKVC